MAFLTEAFALMPAHWKLRTVRADSGFFENPLLTFLEALGIPYIVVARLTQNVKRKAAELASWTAIFLNVCFTYNLLSLYQHASSPEQRKTGFKRPVTLRAEVFIGGAVLGTRSRTPVLYIAESWGGLDKHKPLLENILRWPGATSPKLPPEPPGDEQSGGKTSENHCAA